MNAQQEKALQAYAKHSKEKLIAYYHRNLKGYFNEYMGYTREECKNMLCPCENYKKFCS